MKDTNTFNSLNLLPSIKETLNEFGFVKPSPIQLKAIPYLLTGNDLLGIAKTGSGKTAAFCLPILNKIVSEPREVSPFHIRALVLTPTRELASQIEKFVQDFGDIDGVSSLVVFGGARRANQVESLKDGVDILVATPGRLIDLIESNRLSLDEVETFILDEADMMLDMGFLHDVKAIISYLPARKQVALFSATMPKSIERLSKEILVDPVKVKVDIESTVVEKIEQRLYPLHKKNKLNLLLHLLENEELSKVLLFSKTKIGADILVEELLENGISCSSFHSNKSQAQREIALESFRMGEIRLLVATDVAARGIDILDITHVINYSLPEEISNYVHRIGRTGRAGGVGVAITFCVSSEWKLLESIESKINEKIPVVTDHPYFTELNTKDPHSKKKKARPKSKSKKKR
ncbi:DEAD/DEAH box helicase [Halobacteriovorax sp. JY17]|uniref:DEAD/DEAH box helicase n=1 Tax=Halobacteriovorax sp. JY17 TaxID=2014617 RepID=UPI000C42CF19|nr:DEAD/DEAH box helicase [Halobacteriovorax sp. JY17]PIK16187.1 MAG: DEAD/DEAH box helicase [Halobacteriovorax sp. JY17]